MDDIFEKGLLDFQEELKGNNNYIPVGGSNLKNKSFSKTISKYFEEGKKISLKKVIFIQIIFHFKKFIFLNKLFFLKFFIGI